MGSCPSKKTEIIHRVAYMCIAPMYAYSDYSRSKSIAMSHTDFLGKRLTNDTEGNLVFY